VGRKCSVCFCQTRKECEDVDNGCFVCGDMRDVAGWDFSMRRMLVTCADWNAMASNDIGCYGYPFNHRSAMSRSLVRTLKLTVLPHHHENPIISYIVFG
jgi:hypothetical protein